MFLNYTNNVFHHSLKKLFALNIFWTPDHFTLPSKISNFSKAGKSRLKKTQQLRAVWITLHWMAHGNENASTLRIWCARNIEWMSEQRARSLASNSPTHSTQRQSVVLLRRGVGIEKCNTQKVMWPRGFCLVWPQIWMLCWMQRASEWVSGAPQPTNRAAFGLWNIIIVVVLCEMARGGCWLWRGARCQPASERWCSLLIVTLLGRSSLEESNERARTDGWCDSIAHKWRFNWRVSSNTLTCRLMRQREIRFFEIWSA